MSPLWLLVSSRHYCISLPFILIIYFGSLPASGSPSLFPLTHLSNFGGQCFMSTALHTVR